MVVLLVVLIGTAEGCFRGGFFNSTDQGIVRNTWGAGRTSQDPQNALGA
jgi:hypothetical protein